MYVYTSRKRKRTFLARIIQVKKLGETHIRLSAEVQNHPCIADPIFRPQRVKENYFPLHETPKNGTFSQVKVELIVNKKKSMYPNHFVKQLSIIVFIHITWLPQHVKILGLKYYCIANILFVRGRTNRFPSLHSLRCNKQMGENVPILPILHN